MKGNKIPRSELSRKKAPGNQKRDKTIQENEIKSNEQL